jgi:DHA3 family macrolide efflux protein-like MFS transporter
MMQTSAAPRDWKTPFFTVWTAQQLSLIGSHVGQFALVWWITDTTGSATILATATFVALLPGVFLSPFAGALVDRWSRRLVMIVADGFIAFVALWVVVLFWTESIQLWHIYVLMTARSIGSAFHWPAMAASTSLMVPEDRLPRVAGLNQTMDGTMQIAAPALAALLLRFMPIYAVMGIDVATALLAILPLLFVVIPQPQRTASTTGEPGLAQSIWRDMVEGVRYIRHLPGLKGLFGMITVMSFLSVPAFILLPILTATYFGGGAMQVAWMNGAWGLGLVLGGLLLSAWGGFGRRMITIFIGAIGIGVSYLLIGLTPAWLLPLALLWLLGGAVMNAIAAGAYMALLQAVVAPDIQGRVFTVGRSLTSAMIPLGMLFAGPFADLVGIRELYLVAGAIQVVVVVSTAFVPSVAHLGEEPDRCLASG